MKRVAIVFLLAALIAAAFLVFDYLRPGQLIMVSVPQDQKQDPAERIKKAEERSKNVKGVYMTSAVALDRGASATKLRNDIIELLQTTELNALVIDVKETEGGLTITDELRELIGELHEKNVWVISRQVVFKDSSQIDSHPEWYLRKKDGKFWRDNRGGSWLDPSSAEVWQYQLDAAKSASDAGFDEIQFDYIRFPSDGDVRNIVYPVYDSKQPKYEVLGEFFKFLHDGLKRHRPELILSADLFGYVALEAQDLGIGQRLADIGENFDHVSLMVYPSHYYGGFEVPADPLRNLAALSYPYRSKNISEVAVHHPYEVVYRTLLIAEDILAGRPTTTPLASNTATSSVPLPAQVSQSETWADKPARRAKLRPWLQDFDLAVDSARGIRYDALKVRAQIDAAEAAGSSGWLLWSPDNIYTKDALKPEAGLPR